LRLFEEVCEEGAVYVFWSFIALVVAKEMKREISNLRFTTTSTP